MSAKTVSIGQNIKAQHKGRTVKGIVIAANDSGYMVALPNGRIVTIYQ